MTAVVEAATKIIKTDLVGPFIQSIEKPLQNLSLGDEDNVYLIEEELIAVFIGELESKISETLNRFIAKEKVNLATELGVAFTTSDVRATLNAFFENLQVADLFSEVFEMERNKSILDKQDFYLYFGDISFRNTKYPIFYLPLSVTRRQETLYLEFDSQIYINKRALEFIVQELISVIDNSCLAAYCMLLLYVDIAHVKPQMLNFLLDFGPRP